MNLIAVGITGNLFFINASFIHLVKCVDSSVHIETRSNSWTLWFKSPGIARGFYFRILHDMSCSRDEEQSQSVEVTEEQGLTSVSWGEGSR